MRGCGGQWESVLGIKFGLWGFHSNPSQWPWIVSLLYYCHQHAQYTPIYNIGAIIHTNYITWCNEFVNGHHSISKLWPLVICIHYKLWSHGPDSSPSRPNLVTNHPFSLYLSFLFKKWLLNFTYVCVCASVSHTWSDRCLWQPEEGTGPPAAGATTRVLGTKRKSSGRVVSAFNYWAISPAPLALCL